MRVPLAGGSPQTVLDRVSVENFDCLRRPGSPCLLLEPGSDGKQDVFSNFDPLTGSRWGAFRTPRKNISMVLPPDGSSISTIRTDAPATIEILSRSGEVKKTENISAVLVASGITSHFIGVAVGGILFFDAKEKLFRSIRDMRVERKANGERAAFTWPAGHRNGTPVTFRGQLYNR